MVELNSDSTACSGTILLPAARGSDMHRTATCHTVLCAQWKITVFRQGDWQGNEWGVDNCGLSEVPAWVFLLRIECVQKKHQLNAKWGILIIVTFDNTSQY